MSRLTGTEGEKTALDIFDRVMRWKPLSPLQPFYRKYKEPLLYLFFGGLTFFLSIGLFWLFTVKLSIPALAANIIDWIICVAFAYVTNRTWVFKDKAHDAKGVVRECGAFVIGRLGTLGLEELILWIGIDLLGMNSIAVKVAAQVLVILGNYVISKLFVFRKDGAHETK